jgi:hypothetical protein
MEEAPTLDRVKAMSFVVDKKYRGIQTGIMMLGVAITARFLAVLLHG